MPAPVIQKDSAGLVEIFSSAQGEGPLVGCRQVFVRFCGCNLECAYCDTDHVLDQYCRLEKTPGSGHFENLENPVRFNVVADLLRSWLHDYPGLHHSVILTGGEPLHQGELLGSWTRELKSIMPVYLETNGTLPDALSRVREDIEGISMDIKLESVCGFKTPWETHRDFLRVGDKKVFCVKLVVDAETPESEVETAASMVGETAPGTVLVLQPLTRDAIRISSHRLLELQAAAARLHRDTRIIPQVHRFLDLL